MWFSDTDGTTEMTESKAAASQRQGRKQLIGMFAIALVTLGGAYALFYAAREGGVWSTTNHGTFVDPPITVAELGLADGSGAALREGGTWWLWVVARGPCEGDCAAALVQLRALHVLLNKDAGRVQRALVTGIGAVPADVADQPGLVLLTGALDRLEDGIYLVDPIGNLVLRYPYVDAGKPVLEDLKRLLKLSQIG